MRYIDVGFNFLSLPDMYLHSGHNPILRDIHLMSFMLLFKVLVLFKTTGKGRGGKTGTQTQHREQTKT